MPGRRVVSLLAGLLVLLGASVVPLTAQDNPDADQAPADSQLAGAVRTADGTAVPGATLRVTQMATGMAWVTWSDEDGKFEFPALPAGHFRVEISQLGFAPGASEIDLSSGVKTPIDLKMDVGTLAAITAASATENAAKVPSAPPANENSNSAPAGANAPSSGPAPAAANPAATAAANNNAAAPLGGGKNGGANGAQRGSGGGRTGQPGRPSGQGGGGRAFQQVGLNGENQNSSESGSEDQTLPLAGGQLGQAASANAVQMIGTVAMGQMPSGGFPQDGGPGGPDMQGAFGNGGNAIPGQAGGQGFGGQGGGPGGPGGPGGGPPGGGPFVVAGRGGGGGRGRGPQGGAQGVAALWGVDRLMRQRVNRVHYSFYDTFSDSALNARPYSLYQANPAKVSGWTESAGMNIGGPLKIPHIYDGTDKTFFYINFGGTWSRNPVDSFAAVPTATERMGDFSNVMLYDPATGQPFAGCPQTCSILPASSASYTPQEKVAQSLLSYIPLPNIPLTNVAGQNFNYHLQTNLPGLSNRLNVNVTHQINAKLSLQVNYNLADATSHGLSDFTGIEGNTFTRGQSLTIGLTQNWTKTFLHSSQLYFSRSRALGSNEFSDVQNIGSNLGLTGISNNPSDFGLPSVNFTNFTGLNDPNFSLARSQTYRYVDAFRWLKAKHTINVGGEVRKMDINRDTDPAPNGQFSFTGQLTSFNTTNGSCDPAVSGIPCGNDFADFLLGYPANTKVQFSGIDNSTATYFRNWGFIGYATDDWHLFPKFTLTYGVRYEAFTPPTEINGDIANLEVGPNFPIPQCITPVATDRNGLNCVASPNASLFRGHYNNWAPRLGIAWQPPGKWFSGQHQLTLRAGFSMFYVEAYLNTLASEMANQPPFATASTLTQQTAPTFPLSFLTNLSSAQPGTVTNTVAVNPNYQVPYAMVWNGGLEYNLTRGTFLEVMYTGTRGVHLDELLGFGPSTSGTTKVAGYTYDTTGAFSNLNALQVRLQKRMSRGLMFMARYTYSKSLDDASTIGGGAQTVLQNNADPRLDYGLSSFNMTHQFLGQFSYALPFGDRQRFATKGWEKAVFGAWRVNATGTVNSGTPFTVRVFSKNQSCQNVPGVNSERANQSGNAALSDPTTLEWFNTAVFSIPAPTPSDPTGCIGNAPRNSVIGPGSFTINSGLNKTIQFGRDGLRRLEFTWNTTNLLNHPNYVGLSTVKGSSTFGEVTSVAGMRAMSFSTRINF